MRSGSPHSAGAEPGRDGAHAAPPRRRWFATSHVPLLGLRYGTLALLVFLITATVLVLFERTHRLVSTPLAFLETAEGVSQRSLNLDATRTKEGLPSLRVSAREAVTLRDGTMELRDVLVTVYGDARNRTEVSAPLAVKGEGAGRGWTFRNGVEVRTEQGLVVRVPEVQYRESRQEVVADGEVLFEHGEMKGRALGLRYFVARRRLEFPASVNVVRQGSDAGFQRIRAEAATLEPEEERITFRRYRAESDAGDVMEGALLRLLYVDDAGTRRLDRMEASGGFLATGPGREGAPPMLGSAARTLSGESMAVEIEADGKVGAVAATGTVRATIEREEAPPRRLSCERLEVDFVGGAAVALTAERQVRLTLPKEGGTAPSTPPSVEAQLLTASLDPQSGEARRVEASGGAVAKEEGRLLEAPRIVYEEPPGRWTLHGSGADPARARGEGVAISAERLEITQADGLLEARGRVKTVTLPDRRKTQDVPPRAPEEPDPDEGPATGTFLRGGEGPMHGISDRLTFRREGREALYRGKVRLWREGQSLQAEEVDLLEGTGRMEARGGVVARLPAAEKEPAGGPQTVTISSEEMAYAVEGEETRFTGGVKAQVDGTRIEALTLTARAGEGERLREMTAEGQVRLFQGTRVGDCDLLVSDLVERRVKMYGRGRLAIIQDQSNQQIVRGAVLTYEEAADRILVESESGGRTWITLDPRAGKRENSDPESPR